ncbi:MAG TPA: hypothetical protein PKE04_14970, partial [Clostridia bacterium]|nr:hypothetical protein [Clostridia bacterium]
LAAPFWTKECKTAHALIRMETVDFIASDAHRPRHYDEFARVIQKMKRRWGETGFCFEAGQIKPGS